MTSTSNQASAATASGRTFHRFQRLAPELRLKIWKAALPGPRVIEVEFTSFWWAPLESNPRTPALAGANRESRRVFLKHYEPICRYMHSDSSSRFKNNKIRPSPIHYYHDVSDAYHTKFQICYFDFEVDTLYLGPSSSGQFLLEPCSTYSTTSMKLLAESKGMSKLRFMACEEKDWWNSCFPVVSQHSVFVVIRAADTKLISAFPSLQRFDLAIGDVGSDEFLRRGYNRGKSLNGERLEVSLHDHIGNTRGMVPNLASSLEKELSVCNVGRSDDKKISFGIKRVTRGGHDPEDVIA